MTNFSAFRSLVAAGAVAALPMTVLAQASDPWIVGEIAALSGPAATVGIRLNESTKLWAEQINKAGGIRGRKVEIITCDDGARPEKAIACARDMLEKKAVLIIEHSLTASIRALEPLVKNGPIMIVASPDAAPASDSYVFQVSPTNLFLTEAIAGFLTSSNVKKLGMIAATDASGEVGVVGAQKVFPAAGINLKLARIDLRATDASTQLASIASDDVSVIYAQYSGAGAVTIAKSYYNLALKQPLIVSYANASGAFVMALKNERPQRLLATSIKALVPELVSDAGDHKRTLAFVEDYRRAYGGHYDNNNLLGKLNTDVAESILRNVKDPTDFKAVKHYLETTPIESVLTLRFSPTSHVGLTVSDVAIVELKDGTWSKADPIK